MKKKMFALLTAVCCLMSGVASLSASAENFNETKFYIISKVYTYDDGRKNFCMYDYSTGKYLTENIMLNNSDIPDITTGDRLPSDYEYGDIITLDKSHYVVCAESYPPYYSVENISELHYSGNCKDLLEIKELTLTDKSAYSWFNVYPDYIDFTFTDEEGKEYEYGTYYYTNNPEIDIDSCAIGDTVTFSVYNDTAILPLELHRNVIPGDADRNGQFDILDVIYLNRVILGRDIISDVNIDVADFNQDGVPDSSDALTMLKMLVGLI